MNFENTVSRFRKVSEHIAELAKVREDAAASFAAYLAMRHARRIARASDWLTHVPRPRLAAFLAFALAATLCAQRKPRYLWGSERRLQRPRRLAVLSRVMR